MATYKKNSSIRFVYKLTAVIVLIIFISNSCAYSIPNAYAAEKPALIHTPHSIDSKTLARFSLPATLGTIEEVHAVRSQKTVILIQDAHAIPDAQKSLERIIEHFQVQYGVNSIALEGAAGKLDPFLFRNFSDKEKLKQVFNDYMDRGEISGVTAAAVLSPIEADYYGVENKKLYEEAIQAFLNALKGQPQIFENLKSKKVRTQYFKTRFYSPGLLKLDREWEAVEEKQADLEKFLQYLSEITPANRGLRSKYPHLAAVLAEAKKDPAVYEKKIPREIQSLVTFLQAHLQNKEILQELNRKRQEYQTEQISPEAFTHFLSGSAQKENLVIHLSGNLEKNTARHLFLKTMRGSAFYKELYACLAEIKEGLFRSKAERRIDKIDSEVRLLHKLASLELTREEWEEVQKLKGSKVKRLSHEKGINLLTFKHLDFSTHFVFYELALKRDQVFRKNISELLNQQKTKTILFVGGGFHMQGLKDAFRKEKISYVLISPRIQSIPEETHYRGYMQGQVSWREYFKVSNGQINLYEAFSKATVERLLEIKEHQNTEAPSHQFKSETGALVPSMLLRMWRDQIIRALASKGEMANAADYTRFVDQSALKAIQPDELEKLKEQWSQKVNQFIEGLRHLKNGNQLTPENVMRLVSQPTATPWTANPLVRGTYPAEFSRSEVRMAEETTAAETVVDQNTQIINKQNPQPAPVKKETKKRFVNRPFLSKALRILGALTALISVPFIVMAWIFFISPLVKVEGFENRPKGGRSFLILGNHLTYMDALLLMSYFVFKLGRLPRFIARPEDLGWFLRGLADIGLAIPIDPSRRTSQAMRQHLHEGMIVGNFPGRGLEKRIDFAGWADSPFIVSLQTGVEIWPFVNYGRIRRHTTATDLRRFFLKWIKSGFSELPPLFEQHFQFLSPIAPPAETHDLITQARELKKQTAEALSLALNDKEIISINHKGENNHYRYEYDSSTKQLQFVRAETKQLAERSEVRAHRMNLVDNGGHTLEDIRKMAAAVNRERERAYMEAAKWQAAMVIYGSARIPEKHPYYALGEEIGARLWYYSKRIGVPLPPRTGAGMSLMDAPLKGYREARGKKNKNFQNQTQGVRIELPFETTISPNVEVEEGNIKPYKYFLIRKIALHENALGTVALPGGFGTLDELFESWRRHKPIVLLDEDYWKPILQAYYDAFKGEGLLDKVTNRPLVTSSVDAAIKYILEETEKNPPVKLDHTKLAEVEKELEINLEKIYSLPRSVVFVGRPDPVGSAEELKIAEELANQLVTKYKVPVRVASRGLLLERIHKKSIAQHWENSLQAVLRVPPHLPLENGERTLVKKGSALIVRDQSNSQFLTASNAGAYVFLPGMQGTQNRLMDIATLMQTGKMAKRPVILIGREFYAPILYALAQTMLKHKMISPADMDFFIVVDSAEEAIEELSRAGVIKQKISGRSELRTEAAAGTPDSLKIPLPKGFWINSLRRYFLNKLTLLEFASALDIPEQKSRDIFDKIVRGANLAVRIAKGKNGLLFGLTGWEKMWLDLWDKEADENLKTNDESKKPEIFREQYISTQFEPPYSVDYNLVHQKINNPEFYIQARQIDYKQSGLDPPAIHRVSKTITGYLFIPAHAQPSEEFDLAIFIPGLGHTSQNPYYDTLDKKLLSLKPDQDKNLKRRIAVFRLDLPGNGEIFKPENVIPYLRIVLKYFRKKNAYPGIGKENIALIGSSLGGYVVLRAVFNQHLANRIQAAVAMNPPVYHTLDDIQKLTFYLGKPALEYRFGRNGKESYAEALKSFQFEPRREDFIFAGDPSRFSVFVGESDKLIDSRDPELLKRVFNGDGVIQKNKGGHTFSGKDKADVFESITQKVAAAFSKPSVSSQSSRSEVRETFVQRNGLENLKNRTVVSLQMEMGLHAGLLDSIVRTHGEEIADLVAQSTLTGGLGALMHDLFPSWKANGVDVIGIHPIYEEIKEYPKRQLALGPYVREAILKTGGRKVIQFPVALTITDAFRARAQGSKAKNILDKKVFVRVLRTETKEYNAPQYYLDAYYLREESLEDTDDNRVRIFDEVYPDDRLWRDIQMAVYRQAAGKLVEVLQNEKTDEKLRIKTDLVYVHNEVFVSLPIPKSNQESKTLHHHINHSVFKPTIYEPDEVSYELLGFPEWQRQFIVKDGKVSIVDHVALSHEFFTGVSLDEHTPVLEKEIFPNARHKLRGYHDEEGVRSTNGVLVEHWQSPERGALIAQYRKRLGLGENATDRDFYEAMKLPENTPLKNEFERRNELIKAVDTATLLVWLAEKQGNRHWLDRLYSDLGKPEVSGRRLLKTFQTSLRRTVASENNARWEWIEKRYHKLIQALMTTPIVSNVRRQVPYKGPEKWLEVLLKKPLMEVFQSLGKDHALHLLGSLAPDPIMNSGDDKNRAKLWDMIHRIKNNHGEWWQELNRGFEVLPVPVLNLPLFGDVRNRLASGTQAAKLFKERTGRIVIGGRTFDPGAYANFDAIKKLIGLLGLQDHLATVENYNIREAHIIFQGVAGVVMLSDELLEASATSPAKGVVNGAALIGVWGGFMPELFTLVDDQGRVIDIFERKVSHDEVTGNLNTGKWKLINGHLVRYAGEEKSDQEGGERRPSAQSLEDGLIWLKQVYSDENVRRNLQYESLATTPKVNMREGQARAHAFLWEQELRYQGKMETMFKDLKFSLQDAVKVFNIQAGQFRWLKPNQTVETSDPGIPGFLEGFRRLTTRGAREKRGKDALASLFYHAERGDIFAYLNDLLNGLSNSTAPLHDQIRQLAKSAEQENDINKRVKLNLQAMEILDRYTVWLAGKIYEAYFHIPQKKLYPDTKIPSKEQMFFDNLFANRLVGKNIARYLEDQYPQAISLAANERGIRIFGFQHNGKRIAVPLNVGAIAYPTPEGEKKAWGRLLYNAQFEEFLGEERSESDIVYQIHDMKRNHTYNLYSLSELKNGLSIGVSGVQFLEIIPKKNKTSILPFVASARQPVQAALSLRSSVEHIKEAVQLGPQAVEEVFAIDAALSSLDAEKKFGRPRIPAFMTLIAALAPHLLDEMQSWDPKFYAALKRVISENKELFEKGEVTFHSPSRDDAIVFSRSLEGGDNGKNIIFAIQFGRESYSYQDGKAWSVVRNVGSETTPLRLDESGIYRVRNLLTSAVYNPRLGYNLFRHWDIGIAVQDVKWQEKVIQEGWGVDIYRLEKFSEADVFASKPPAPAQLPQSEVQKPSDLQVLEINTRAYFQEEGFKTFDDFSEDKLREMKEFGFNALWMMGIYEESSASRALNEFWGNKEGKPGRVASAYAIPDYRINAALGGEEAFERLVERANKIGLRMVVDFIPNHLSKDSPLIDEHPDWFIHRTIPPPDKEKDFFFEHTLPDGRPIWIAHGKDESPWQDTAQLNLMNPEVWGFLKERLLYLARLTRGGGVRIDSLQAVHPKIYRARWFPHIIASDFDNHMRAVSRLVFDRDSARTSRTNVFDSLLASVKEQYPDFKTIGEVYHGQHGDWQQAGVDLTYAKYVYNWLVFHEEGDWQTFKDYLFRRGQHKEVLHDYLLRSVYFLENHDERIRVLEKLRQRFSKEFGERKDQVDGEIINWSKLLATAIATMPGVPMLYLGQTEGRSRHIPSADWIPPREWLTASGETKFEELSDFYRWLLKTTLQPVFRRGSEPQEIPLLGNQYRDVIAFTRHYENQDAIVILNHSRQQVNLTLDLPAVGLAEKPYSLSLGPWGIDVDIKTNRSELRPSAVALGQQEHLRTSRSELRVNLKPEPIEGGRETPEVLRHLIDRNLIIARRQMMETFKHSRENGQAISFEVAETFRRAYEEVKTLAVELKKEIDNDSGKAPLFQGLDYSLNRFELKVVEMEKSAAGKTKPEEPRSEVRSVIESLAKNIPLSQEAAKAFVFVAQLRFEETALAVEVEAQEEAYLNQYALNKEESAQELSLYQAEREAQFRQTHPNYNQKYSEFIKTSIKKIQNNLHAYLEISEDHRLNFAFGFRAESAKVRDWLLTYMQMVKSLKDRYPSRVQGNLRIFVTSSELKDASLGVFFKEVGKLGVAKVIELNTSATAFQIQDYLSRNPNALIYGLSGPIEIQEKDRIRLVRSEVSVEATLPVALLLSTKLAPVKGITAELLKKVPDLLPQGVLGYNGTSLVIARAALELIYRVQASRLIARMA